MCISLEVRARHTYIRALQESVLGLIKIHFGVLCRPLFPSFNSRFCSSESSTLLPHCAASRLREGPTALSIDSSTGGTLASWGNSTSPKFRGLEVLSPLDSLRSSTHEGSTRVTHVTLRNSASVDFQGKKCCLYKMPYVAAPIQVPRWRHCKFYALRMTSYRRTYKSQKFLFWFTSDVFWKRPVSSYQDSYINFYKEIYKRRWYQKRTTYCLSGGVLQEYLKRLYKQTLLWLVIMSRSLRNPDEQDDHKKRDVEQSAPTHVRHTHCTPMQLGTTANWSKTFLGTDFEKRAKWQGSVEEPAAKDFAGRKVRTIEWNKV
jgi:hypothetical protein